ncbi:MAG TPA: hypothetical protein VGH86_14340 [Phenylobacterium sp.]|jgi:hypothetical protein
MALAAVVAAGAGLLAGCEAGRPTFGGAKAKAHDLVRAQFQLTHLRFSKESGGYSPEVVCGLFSADSPSGPTGSVEFIANGDTDSAVINDQALGFDVKPPAHRDEAKAAEIGIADCIFPQLWKAVCRQPFSEHLLQQEKRCPP